MADRKKLKFGVHTGLQHTSIAELVPLWSRIEELGFDFISIWDHFYTPDSSGSAHCLEAVSAHTALACHTSRVQVGSLVYSIGFRHPAVLANAIANIDQISGGRTELGLGAGWLKTEYDAYGIPYPSAGVRLDMLEEGVQCIRGLFQEKSFTFAGIHFQLQDAQCEPGPSQERLPIFIGGGGEKRTLRIAAKYADGWNIPFVSPETYAYKRGVLTQHCESVGRDPATIQCSVNLGLAWHLEHLREQFGAMGNVVKEGVLFGSDEEIRDKVGHYRDAGVQQINLALRAPFSPELLEHAADLLLC